MTFCLALHGGASWSQVRSGFEDRLAVIGKIDPPGINAALGLVLNFKFSPSLLDLAEIASAARGRGLRAKRRPLTRSIGVVTK
jgi:hypothetical protein